MKGARTMPGWRTIRTLGAIILVALLASPMAPGQDELEGPPLEAAARQALEGAHWSRAQVYFEKLVGQKRSAEHLMGLGRALFQQGENQHSLACFEEALKKAPQDPEPPLYVALTMERQGRASLAQGKALAESTLADAVLFYRQAAGLSADPYAPRFWAGEVLLLLDRYGEAAEEFRSALAAHPGDRAVRERLAIALYLGGDLKAFLDVTDGLLRETPDHRGLLNKRLTALARLGRVQDADALFRKLVLEQPDEGLYFDALETAWKEPSRMEHLEKLYRSVAAESPGRFLPHYRLGVLLTRLGRLESALSAFLGALEISPRDPYAAAGATWTLEQLGRLDEAEQRIRAAWKDAPGHPVLAEEVKRLVAALVTRHLHDRALALHTLIWESEPDATATIRNQAILLKDAGLREEAAAMLARLLKEKDLTAKERSSHLNDLALVKKGLGRTREAESTLREALEADPENLDARENLAVLLFDLGRRDEALSEVRRVLGDPDGALRERARYYARRLGN